VVLDFGMASAERDPHGREVVGTPEYMSPEQAASSALGPATDWYAVGAVLYHALVGRPPFEGPPLEVMLRKQDEDPPPPRLRAPEVPADLDALCQGLLARDPRQRPTPHTLLAAPGARGVRTSTLGAPGTFVGRARELRQLATLLADSRRATTLVVVEGASGVGKSALVRRAADQATVDHGAVVLASRCHERESVSGGGADGLIDALARALRRLDRELVAACAPRRLALLIGSFPALRTVEAFGHARRDDPLIADPFTRRSRALGALRELLARLADRRPVMLLVDDLQWADQETLAFLDSVLAPPDAPAVLLLSTWRRDRDRDDLPPPLARAHRISIEALDPDSTVELATELLRRGGRGPGDAHALARESGGHPLLLDVLVSRAFEEPRRARVSLREALAGRIEALDPVGRGVLDALIVAGAPIEETVLAGVLDVPPVAIARSITALRAERLVRSTRDGDRLLAEVHHDQVSACGLALLGAERRRALHAAFANLLEARGQPDPERLLDHLRGAGELASAAKVAVRAGVQARDGLAFHRAARLFATALELGGEQLAERAAVRRLQADSLAAAGRGAEAAEHYLACAAEAAPAEALDLRRLAAQQLLISGRTTAGLAALHEVLDREGLVLPRTPRAALARVAWRRLRLALRRYRFTLRRAEEVRPRDLTRIDVCWHVGLGLSIVDTMRGQAFNAQGILLALQAGEPHRLGRALALEMAYRGTRGATARAAIDALDVTVTEIARSTGDAHVLGLTIGCRGIAAFLRGDWRDAATCCREAEVIFSERCQGVPWELATAKLYATRALVALGDLDGIADRVERDIRDSRDRGDLYGETSLRAAVVPFVHLVRGEPAAAASEAEHALDRWTAVDFQLQHYFQASSRATVDLYRGDPRAGLARLAEHDAALQRSMLLRVQHVRGSLLDLRARLLLSAGGHDDEVRAIAARLRRERAAWLGALADALDAALASRRRHRERGIASLRAALDGFTRGDMTMHAMAARWRLGQLLDDEEGRASTRAAEAWARAVAIADPGRLFATLVPP
jgi:hypothetical protein